MLKESWNASSTSMTNESSGWPSRLALSASVSSITRGEFFAFCKQVIIRENFLQKGLLGKFYMEKLKNSQNYRGQVS